MPKAGAAGLGVVAAAVVAAGAAVVAVTVVVVRVGMGGTTGLDVVWVG